MFYINYNQPGYLPDNDPIEFDDIDDIVEYLNDIGFLIDTIDLTFELFEGYIVDIGCVDIDDINDDINYFVWFEQ